MFAGFVASLMFYGLDPALLCTGMKALAISAYNGTKGGLTGISIIVGIIVVLSLLPKFIAKRTSGQALRSFYHLISGIVVAYFLVLSRNTTFLVLSMLIGVYFLLEYLRQSDDRSSFTLFLKDASPRILKGHEMEGYTASFFYLLGALLVVLFLPIPLALGAVLVLGIGDSTATIVGLSVGRHNWTHNPDKSVEGTLGMFLTSLLVLQILDFGTFTTLLAAAGASAFESFKINLSDNIVVPLISAIIMISLSM